MLDLFYPVKVTLPKPDYVHILEDEKTPKGRICSKCEQDKPVNEFYGKSHRCKDCTKEYQHNYYHKFIKKL